MHPDRWHLFCHSQVSIYPLMKTHFISSLFVLTILFSIHSQAQVKVNVNVNLGMQPAWGPVGYERVEYYYLPDIDIYYYVPRHQFVYIESGHWIFATALPVRYRSYDLYGGYKVVINEPHPYRRCDYYRGRYGKYKGWHGKQEALYARGYKDGYKNASNHGHGNGHGNGQGKQGKGHSKHH